MEKQNMLKTGLGMTGPTYMHQYVVGRIFKNFVMKYDGDHILMGVAVNDKPEIIPDLSIWKVPVCVNSDPKDPIITIEVTHILRNDKYSEKNIRRTFDLIPSLQEAFIYNYSKQIWVRYRVENDKVVKEENKDFSHLLSCHFSTLLK